MTAVQNLAGKVLGTVKVEPGQSACGDECAPAMCGGVKVVQSAEACDEVATQLRQSVVADTAGDPLELSHVLFLDVQATATSGFMTVAICPNHKWTCTDPATPAVSHVDFEGLLSFSIVQGSACFCTSRLCPYCCATATKTIITPCPK